MHISTPVHIKSILLCAAACVLLATVAISAADLGVVSGDAIEPAQSIQCPRTLRGGYEIEDYLASVAGALGDSSQINIKVEQIGLSLKKYPISLVSIHGRKMPDESTGGVLAIAAQHGNEPAGTVAAMRLIHQIAINGDKNLHQLLSNVPFYIIPIANPDAAQSFKRRAANGMNMNRDWNSYSLPETQAIERIIRRIKPDVLLDLHELTAGEPNRPYIEGVSASGKAYVTQSVKTTFRRQGIRVPVKSSRPTSRGGRLLHRHFALKYGRPAFLVESKCPGDPKSNLTNRANLHCAAVLAVLNELSSQKILAANRNKAAAKPQP